MYLYHYYDKDLGPFLNLSELSIEKANLILNDIKMKKPNSQCAKRQIQYMEDRHHYEEMIRDIFIKQQGKVERMSPHYMVVEHSPWLSTWYDHSAYLKIPVEEFDLDTISFTYGDSHPTFSPKVNDGKEYRRKLYKYNEILEIIKQYGLPQDWNDDGKFGPERYIEVQIWSDEVISRYR